jgi:hypothetical protein
MMMIRRLPSLLPTTIAAALRKPQRCPKSSEDICYKGDTAMYDIPVAVWLLSAWMELAYPYKISPNSHLLLNTDRLAAERLNWETPLPIKKDQSMVLNVRRTFECNEKYANMLPSLMISQQLTDKRPLNYTTVFSSRD